MIVLDVNIVLEILEERRLYGEVIRMLEKYATQGVDSGISTLTVSNTFYLAESHKLPTERVETLINSYKLFGVSAADVEWALAHYSGKDFEDALQVSAAIREECTAFLTLDVSLVKKYNKFLKVELISD